MTTTSLMPVRARDGVRIPLQDGTPAIFIAFDGFGRHAEHFAVRFEGRAPNAVPLVRLHSECITGDLFGSQRCDCGAQLHEAQERLKEEGGVLLYMRQEGRGIGLFSKLAAYQLQDQGLDTYAANRALELPEDGRDYADAAAMLKALHCNRIRLLSNNPDKANQLERDGIEVVERIPTGTYMTPHNQHYLRTKEAKSGHLFQNL